MDLTAQVPMRHAGSMRIAVIGAGIGGLTAAAGLSADGHDVVVYEQRTDAGAVGAGITLFGNAFAALDEIGTGDIDLGERVRAISSGAISALRAGQRSPDGRWLVTLPHAAVATLRSLHRADLHRVLVAALPPGVLRLGVAATARADGEPVVETAAGSERFDLVVAADGIRSAARARLGLDGGVRYAGYTAWRGVTTAPVEVPAEAGETWGRGERFGIVPLPDGRVYWFATATTAAGGHAADERAAVLDRIGHWHAPVRACIEATAVEAVLRHDIHDLVRLPERFVRGRTVLLGDAAHAMTPDLGQGAGQAIEDAATLVLLLRRHADLDSALTRYDALRRPRTAQIWQRSRLMGRVGQLANPVGAGLRDLALRATPGAAMGRPAVAMQRWRSPADD